MTKIEALKKVVQNPDISGYRWQIDEEEGFAYNGYNGGLLEYSPSEGLYQYTPDQDHHQHYCLPFCKMVRLISLAEEGSKYGYIC